MHLFSAVRTTIYHRDHLLEELLLTDRLAAAAANLSVFMSTLLANENLREEKNVFFENCSAVFIMEREKTIQKSQKL